MKQQALDYSTPSSPFFNFLMATQRYEFVSLNTGEIVPKFVAFYKCLKTGESLHEIKTLIAGKGIVLRKRS